MVDAPAPIQPDKGFQFPGPAAPARVDRKAQSPFGSRKLLPYAQVRWYVAISLPKAEAFFPSPGVLERAVATLVSLLLAFGR